MGEISEARRKLLAEWECDPYRLLKPQIERLLRDIRSDYERLTKHGTALDYRLAVGKHAAEAKGILNVVAACDATPFRRDIL